MGLTFTASGRAAIPAMVATTPRRHSDHHRHGAMTVLQRRWLDGLHDGRERWLDRSPVEAALRHRVCAGSIGISAAAQSRGRAGSASSYPPGRSNLSLPIVRGAAGTILWIDGRDFGERSEHSERVRPGTKSATDLYLATCTDRMKGPVIGRVSSEARPGRSGTDLRRTLPTPNLSVQRRQGRRGECERSEHLAARVASAEPSVRRRPTIDLWRSEREARGLPPNDARLAPH